MMLQTQSHATVEPNLKCPVNDQCQSQDIIYKCTVSTSINPDEAYLGTTEADFKKRYRNYMKSFRNKRCTNDTSLSKYICGNTMKIRL